MLIYYFKSGLHDCSSLALEMVSSVSRPSRLQDGIAKKIIIKIIYNFWANGFRFGIRFDFLLVGKKIWQSKFVAASVCGAFCGARLGKRHAFLKEIVDCVVHCHAVLQDRVYRSCFLFFRPCPWNFLVC